MLSSREVIPIKVGSKRSVLSHNCLGIHRRAGGLDVGMAQVVQQEE